MISFTRALQMGMQNRVPILTGSIFLRNKSHLSNVRWIKKHHNTPSVFKIFSDGFYDNNRLHRNDRDHSRKISRHVLKVLKDENVSKNPEFINYVIEYTRLNFSTLFRAAKDRKSTLTEKKYIEENYSDNVFSSYKYNSRKTSNCNDLGTILDKDFFNKNI